MTGLMFEECMSHADVPAAAGLTEPVDASAGEVRAAGNPGSASGHAVSPADTGFLGKDNVSIDSSYPAVIADDCSAARPSATSAAALSSLQQQQASTAAQPETGNTAASPVRADSPRQDSMVASGSMHTFSVDDGAALRPQAIPAELFMLPNLHEDQPVKLQDGALSAAAHIKLDDMGTQAGSPASGGAHDASAVACNSAASDPSAHAAKHSGFQWLSLEAERLSSVQQLGSSAADGEDAAIADAEPEGS